MPSTSSTFYETRRLRRRALAYALLAASLAAWIACPLFYLHWLKFVPSVFIALEYLLIVMSAALSAAVAGCGPDLRFSDPKVRRESARAVAAAIWMAPLTIFVLERSILSGVVAAGIVFAAYTARGHSARECFDETSDVSAHGMREGPQLEVIDTAEFAKQLASAIFIATLLQGAAVADLIYRRELAVVLFVVGAALLARQLRLRIDDSGARTREFRAKNQLLASAIMAVFAIVIGLLPLLLSSGRPANLLDALLRQLLFRAGSPQIARRDSVRIEETHVPSGGYIGVILTPKQSQTNRISALPQISAAAQVPSSWRPLMIPFTGSYWFFQSPFARPPGDSVNAEGDPASVGVRASNYRPLLMEAVQNLYQPLETARVGEVQLAMLDIDPLPGTVSVELVLADTSAWGHPVQSLGSQRVGAPTLVGSVSNSHSENLSFLVPRHSHCREFNQLRLIFTLDSSRSRQAAAVAVQSFMLVPRAM